MDNNNGTPFPKTNAPFRILDLPPEIFTVVCDDLMDKDIISIRSVCRVARDKSMYSFGNLFEKLIVHLHPVSLEVLLEIASHEDLSKHVRQVCIIPGRISNVYFDSRFDPADETRADKLMELRDTACAKVSESDFFFNLLEMEKAMLKSNSDSTYLISSFNKLRGSIRVVEIPYRNFWWYDDTYLPCGRRLLYSPEDPRCGIGFSATPIGTLRDYQIILEALREVNVPNIQLTLNIHPRPYQGVASLPIPSLIPSAWLDYGLQNLSKLSVIYPEDSAKFIEGLHSATNLEELRISCNYEANFFDGNYAGHFWWPKLRKLKLQGGGIHDFTIAPFLDRHRNCLTDISIHNTTAVDGDWIEVLRSIRNIQTLDFVELSMLQGNPVSASTEYDFDEYPSADPDVVPNEEPTLNWLTKAINLERSDIECLDVVIQDYRTRPGDEDGEVFVDLRKANAVKFGYIVWNGTSWIVSAPVKGPMSV